MARDIQSEGSKALDQVEHNSDANAKRVIPRYLNASTGTWSNLVPNLVPGTDFDYLDAQQTDAVTTTYVFKLGGASGTIVRTIVFVYTSSNQTDIDTITWS